MTEPAPGAVVEPAAGGVVESAAALACPACGTPAVPGARFCFACGAPLGQLPAGAGLDPGTERRVVTVLFGDLSDFTSWAEDLDPERVGVVTDRVLAALTHAVANVGGHVDKLTGDGIMAVFGAPTAHEDDAERAVRAAAAMQTAVGRLVAEEAGGGRRLGLRVGLNTGEVLAGRQAALSYTVVGDTVNTAARLSDAAGVGAVYAGRETAVATMAGASWRQLPPLRLKGKREPVPAYELVGLRSSRAVRLGLGDEAPFIGRDAELGLLAGRLHDVLERGRPRSVLVVGEAGVGKTRLAQEFTRLAGDLSQSRVLWGRCAPYGEGRDLAPLVEFVRTACGIDEGDDAATATARVRRTVSRLEHPAYAARVPAALVDRLLELLGLVAEEPTVPRDAATPGARLAANPTLEAVAGLLIALAAEAPLVLVVDDLQWASPALLDALVAVSQRFTGQVLFVGVGRPDFLELRADDWQALPEPELLPLAPLEEAATERLLRAYLGGSEPDARMRAALLERAQGNPFFLAELLHLLVDRGLLRHEGSGWVLDPDVPGDVLPAGVQAVLAARIDGLEPPTKAVLRDAAVAGSRFSADVLVALGALSGHGDRNGVERELATLVERQLLRPGEDSTYVFAHALGRDVAYAGILKAERARRHAAVARWAVQRGPGPQDDVDAVVATQGERAVRLAGEMRLPAGDAAWSARGPAVEALYRLAQAALDRDDYAGAEELFGRARRLEAGSAVAAEGTAALARRVGHAEALAGLNRLAEADDELGTALASTDPRIRARALVVLGDVRRKCGEEDAARKAFVSALAVSSEAGMDRITGEALRQLGLLDYFNGRLRSAEEHFAEALALADRVGDPRGAGWALQHLAWSATTRGDYATAETALDRAAEVFTSLEDAGGLAWCAGTEGFVRLFEGRLTEARELARSLLPRGEGPGEAWGLAACLTIDAIAAAELGDVSTARFEAEQAALGYLSVGDGWGQAVALTAQGIAARAAGDAEHALALLGAAVELSEAGRHPLTASFASVMAGYCHLDRGELDAAEQAARASLEDVAGLELEPHVTLGVQVLLAQVLRARGDLDAALDLLSGVVATTEHRSLLFPRRQALAHYAGTLLAAGRADEALARAREAVAEPAEDVRSHVVSLRALGAALIATGDAVDGRAALAEALAAAQSTEFTSEVAASRRALAALGT